MNRKLIVITLLSSTLLCPSVFAAGVSETASLTSAEVSASTASMVVNGLSYFPNPGKWVVKSVSHVGSELVLELKNVSEGASDATSATLKVSETVAGKASVGVGESVQMVAAGAGIAISLAGSIIAYIPSEVGKSLVHHSPL
jgi:hypothetical protein